MRVHQLHIQHLDGDDADNLSVMIMNERGQPFSAASINSTLR
jgi:hypothetical protein